MAADILGLDIQPADAAGPIGQIRQAGEGVKVFGLRPRRGIAAWPRDQPAQGQPRLFLGLAQRAAFGRLAAVDPACHRFQQPGLRIAAHEGAHAELLDHQHPVADGVIGQHHHRIGRDEGGARHRLCHLAIEAAPGDVMLLDREEPGIGLAEAGHLHIARDSGAALQRRHALPRPHPRPAAHQHLRIAGQHGGGICMTIERHEIACGFRHRVAPAVQPGGDIPGSAVLPAPLLGPEHRGGDLPASLHHHLARDKSETAFVKRQPRPVTLRQPLGQHALHRGPRRRRQHREILALRHPHRMIRQHGGAHGQIAPQNGGAQGRMAQGAVEEHRGHRSCYLQMRAARCASPPASIPPTSNIPATSGCSSSTALSSISPNMPCKACTGPSYCF